MNNEFKESISERIEEYKNMSDEEFKSIFDSPNYRKHLDDFEKIIRELPNVQPQSKIKFLIKMMKDPAIRSKFPEHYDNIKHFNILPLINTCVALAPLFGLLGTVTGMIEVFQVMAFTGGGDARSMAGGVSKATLPTMAGMTTALSGVFATIYLNAARNREESLIKETIKN